MVFSKEGTMILTFSLILVASQALANPTFQKISCEFASEESYDLCIYVDYPDKTDDMLLLRKVHGEETVFKGHLFMEKTSVCAVIQDASNPNDMEIVLHSKHSSGRAFFHVDLNSKGVAETIDVPPHTDIALPLPNETFFDRTLSSRDENIDSRALPSSGFRLNVHVFYDDTFNTRFGALVMTRINAIFTIVTTIYEHSSLTTVLEPNIIQTTYVPGATWEANEPILRDVSANIANPSTSNGNAYVFLCSQNNQGGVVGIAWVGGTCSGSRFGRSSVNEYLSSDIITASTVAHEIGHNLGMDHDFGASPSIPRVSSQGEACTNVGGYMDYRSNPNRWSPCSVEDFTAYFDRTNPWCLTPLPNNPTITTTTSTSTSTTTTTTTTTSTSTTTTSTSTTTTTMTTSTTTTSTSTTTTTMTTSTTSTATSTSESTTTSPTSSTSTSTTTTSTGTTSTTSSSDTTTTPGCTDRRWCRWKPQWLCRWSIIKKYCPNKCGTCDNGETTTTETPEKCEDRWPSWRCRWNRWRCRFSRRVRRNCRDTCNQC